MKALVNSQCLEAIFIKNLQQSCPYGIDMRVDNKLCSHSRCIVSLFPSRTEALAKPSLLSARVLLQPLNIGLEISFYLLHPITYTTFVMFTEK